MKKILKAVIPCLLVLLFILSSCKNADNAPPFFDEYPTGDVVETIEVKRNPEATITLEDGSEIELELYYYAAPNTVADFIALANEKVYNGMAFNTVRNNCIVMLGSKEGEFEPPYYVMDELEKSENSITHEKGVVSMCRTTGSDTITGQFFILTEDQKHFDSTFTAFGKVTKGLDIIEKIASSEKNEDNVLLSPYVIKSVKVNTHGINFPLPNIIPIDSENQ